jgi:hypothetical protein
MYKIKPRSDPTDQFFAVMRNLKSSIGTSAAISAPAQHTDTYMRACEIELYEEDGEVYNKKKTISATT